MTPIISFIEQYNASGTVRAHMPGHKGCELTGSERYDITEIRGADELFEAQGIIAQSEAAMSALYGSARTCYSTEGSSLCIKAMLAASRELLGDLRIAAPRNSHRAFINGCVLLGLDPVTVAPEAEVCEPVSSAVTPADVRRTLDAHPELNALYITSPDYLGCMADIRGISAVCRERGVLLLVDNAHGAYLRFAGEGLHPLELGADLCCDSAHKTLPALTGAALLHVSRSAPQELCSLVKDAMQLFASTSPSYVILSSLDRLTAELAGELPERIRECCGRIAEIKSRLRSRGFVIPGEEPMKLTVNARPLGYTGSGLGDFLRTHGIEPEYTSEGCAVLMLSPYNTPAELEATEAALTALPARTALSPLPPLPGMPRRAMSLREAYFAPHERVPIDEAEGRICSRTLLSGCPSVPVILGGEIFDRETIFFLKKYSFFSADVIK
ncbi:MAG: arginine decarboxylase [Ruminococcus sp.]|nr:arginine decarboxylase [Ruminococcus sp.]